MARKQQAELNWRGLRLALGLTQHRMAELLGIQRRAIQRLEHGTRRPAPFVLSHLRVLLKHPEVQRRLHEAGFPNPLNEEQQC